MYQILQNKCLTEKIFLLEVVAPLVVNNALPGQFVIVMSQSDSERIPLTIYDYDKEKGLLRLIYQVVGASTYELSQMQDNLFSVVGPLGKPGFIINNLADYQDKRILFVAGGIGIAPVMPQLKYLKAKGIKADVIYGAKSQNLIILEDEIRANCANLYLTTDDGSYGSKGLVTDLLVTHHQYDLCITIGPLIMMKYVALKNQTYGIKTIASMNPLMVDGTGMCGACRLRIGDKIQFACVDGPEFIADKIDFDAALKRMTLYQEEEGRAYLRALEGNTHHGGCGMCGEDDE